MSNDATEDLIEATIRRVAEAKASREAVSGDSAAMVPPSDDGAAAAVDAPSPAPTSAADDGRPQQPAAVDEDLIEATIRRVAAARAASGAAVVPDMTEPPGAAAQVEPTPIFAAHHASPSAGAPETGPHGELRALRQEVAAMKGMLAELQARVDAALSAAASSGPADTAEPAEDDWDDAPLLPRVPLGQPIRPPILRNPAPQSAEAEGPVEVEADGAPAASSMGAADLQPARRGFDLLPRSYRVTVEDKRRGVDLVPLHRALLAMEGVRDMSLLSYSNGVAIISIELVHELAPELLRQAVSRAMSRGASVEVHNDTTMVVKLAEE
ncbi:MAG TPA: hypothetical protein VEZ14_06450 [Dehalococcoidia bacterium]|nr:hypothetical protein [Dehalococcoidia bacterium]